MECKISKSRNRNERTIRLDGQDILQSNNFEYLKEVYNMVHGMRLSLVKVETEAKRQKDLMV